jgi:hypothetical protein
LQKNKKSKAFFWLPFLSFLVWNIGSTWWIKNASFGGLIVALIVNSTMMTLPFWLSSITHRRLGKSFGYFSGTVVKTTSAAYPKQNFGLFALGRKFGHCRNF